MLERLIHREAGRIGRDLEQHASRLTKIDGVEIFPVYHGCDVVAQRGDLLPPGALLLVARGAESHVVHIAGADVAGLAFGSAEDVYHAAMTGAARAQAI